MLRALQRRELFGKRTLRPTNANQEKKHRDPDCREGGEYPGHYMAPFM